MNKLRNITIICIFIFVFFSKVSLASTATVTADSARIRKDKNTDATILTIAYKDQTVEVLETVSGWVKVKFQDYTGYIRDDLVKITEDAATVEPISTATTETVIEEETTVETTTTPVIVENVIKTVTVDSNIQISPVIYSSIIDTVKSGIKVTLIESINNWAYVTYSNKSGWIKLTNLSENTETSTSTNTTTTTDVQNKKGYVNANSANVRKTAETNGEIIGSLILKQEIEILETSGEWYKINIEGKTGYVFSKLIVFKLTEITSRSSTAERTTIVASSASPQIETTTVQTAETTIQSTTTTTSSSTTGQQIVDTAMKYLGYKYVLGGKSPEQGFDCASFTWYVYKQYGYTLGTTATPQANNGTAIARADMQIGDLIIFNNDANTSIGHVGIFIGNNKFIHAANPQRGVVIDDFTTSTYYKERFVCVRRILTR